MIGVKGTDLIFEMKEDIRTVRAHVGHGRVHATSSRLAARLEKAADGKVKVEGPIFELPKGYGIVHDPDGEVLRPCDVYLAPFRMTREKVKLSPKLQEYFGVGTEGRRLVITKPSGAWHPVGHVTMIWYYRPGTRAPGDYFHPFYKDRIFRKEPLGLWRAGRVYMLALPGDCVVNHRGFVYP
jgi:hypothetical protein